MKQNIRKQTFKTLYEVADDQEGFFTAQQAIDAGFGEKNHAYHVKSGNWIREQRGIYRLANYPRSDRWDLILYYFWSRDRNDDPQGIYSHETAMSFYELSDLNPSKLHMTVPKGFRRTEVPKIIVLHYGLIPKTDLRKSGVLKFTTPFRTILDLITSNQSDEKFIQQGIKEGLHRGLLTKEELKDPRISGTVSEKLKSLLKGVI